MLTAGRPDGEIALLAENVGDASASGEGSPVTIADALPPGLKAIAIDGTEPEPQDGTDGRSPLSCQLAALSCEFKGRLAPMTPSKSASTSKPSPVRSPGN